jgi:hypothetical protein
MTDRDGDPVAADDQDGGAEHVDRPDYATAESAVGRGENQDRWTRLLIELTKRIHIITAGVAIALGIVLLVLDVDLGRSEGIILGTLVLGALAFGYPAGSKAASLLGGPQLMWLVDVDLLDQDGAGVYSCPTTAWAEWDVVEDELWWATPNLAFGQNVDLENQTVEGCWPGTVPEPVLMRSLAYLRYNRSVLEQKAKRGEHIETNAFGMLRSATAEEVKQVVSTFERGTLPDDGEAFHSEVDKVLREYGLDDDLARPADESDDDADDRGSDDPRAGERGEPANGAPEAADD